MLSPVAKQRSLDKAHCACLSSPSGMHWLDARCDGGALPTGWLRGGLLAQAGSIQPRYLCQLLCSSLSSSSAIEPRWISWGGFVVGTYLIAIQLQKRPPPAERESAVHMSLKRATRRSKRLPD